jgi:O-antigen ligase
MISIAKEKYYDIIVFSLLFTLSFSKALPTIFLGMLIPFFFIKIFKKQFLFPTEKGYYIFSFLFLYLITKSLFNNTVSYDISLYSRYLFVIVIPFLFIPVSKNTIKLGVIISVFTAVLIAVFHIMVYYLSFKSLPLGNGSLVNQLLVIERPYFGFICLIASIICLDLANEFPKNKKGLYLLSLFFIFFIFFIVARLSLITVIGLLFVYFLFYSGFSLFKKMLILLVSLGLIILVLFSYKNLSSRFFISEKIEIIKDYEPRFVIWECASEIQNVDNFNLFFGGKSNAWVQNQLNQCYFDSIEKESKRDWFLKSQFNTHNQFIDFFLAGGVIGFFLFFLFLVVLFKVSDNFYMLSIVISLSLFFIMENVLHRQFGCYLTAIIISLVLKKDK